MAQGQYKNFLKRLDWVEQEYGVGLYVYVDIQTKQNSKPETLSLQTFSRETSKKLQLWEIELFKLSSAQSHATTLDGEKPENTVSVYRVSFTRRKYGVDETARKAGHGSENHVSISGRRRGRQSIAAKDSVTLYPFGNFKTSDTNLK